MPKSQIQYDYGDVLQFIKLNLPLELNKIGNF